MSLRKEDLMNNNNFDFSKPWTLLAQRPELDNGQYQEGRQMGADAVDLPASSGFSLRLGYIEGLRSFLAGKNIDSHKIPGFYSSPENLLQDNVVVGFTRGQKRQAPHVGREYGVRNWKYQENLDVVPAWLAELQMRTRLEKDGYSLGFVVGVARDFDVVLTPLKVPDDDPSFNAFMNGLNAVPTAVRETKSGSSQDKYPFEEKDAFSAQLVAYAWEDDQMYHAGLKVWIHSLGLRIDTWQLRHPEALKAFKAALQGQVLPEYEPQEQRFPVGEDSGLKILIYNIIEKKPFRTTLYDDAPNPFEEAKSWGRSGYKLGKSVRLVV